MLCNPTLYSVTPRCRCSKGISIKSVSNWAQRPLGEADVCMVGEAYRMEASGWALGPWLSAVSCVKSHFLDVLPQKDADHMDYIE